MPCQLFGVTKKVSRNAARSLSRTPRKRSRKKGTVIAAGSGTVTDSGTHAPLDIKAGDVILFGKYTSHEIKLDGEEYLIMREDDVLAVIETG